LKPTIAKAVFATIGFGLASVFKTLCVIFALIMTPILLIIGTLIGLVCIPFRKGKQGRKP
jgi:hypothetical protein